MFAPSVSYAAGDFPTSVAIADLDGDGDPDLAVANSWSDNVSILLNNGNGTFAAQDTYAAGDKPHSVATADLDGDGEADLAVANYGDDNVSVVLNNGDGTFAGQVPYAAGWYPLSVAIADLDEDGDADLAVANNWDHNVSVLLNDGEGTFAPQVTYGAGNGPTSVAIADLDEDGDMDLAVANFDSDDVSVLLNNGNGTFAAHVSYPAGNAAAAVAIEDLDGDGDPELAVANFYSDNVSILLNNGNGTFAAHDTYAVGDGPYSVAIEDLDRDGDADLTVGNIWSDNVSVLLNDGGGTFAPHVTYSVGDGPYSVAIEDLDGDGDADLAVANHGSDNVSILLNQSGDCNGNGIPDECDIDCGTNGGPCDIPGCGQSEDCNTNGIPDECDIAAGTSQDTNTNGIPDECPEPCHANELAKLTASDGAAGDHFGSSAALDGDTAVIGAHWDHHAGGADAGSAYVFVYSAGVWTQQAKLTASDAAATDKFGISVALDGDTAVIGAYRDDHAGGFDAGSAYVFVRSGGVWTQQAKLTASDPGTEDLFGFSVALDGDTAVIGAYRDNHAGGTNAGSAYVFVRSGGVWTQQAKLTASDAAADDLFGVSVALNGHTAVIGAPYDDDSSGSAYVFVSSGAVWTQQAKLTAADAAPGDHFAASVALHGDTAVIGAYYDDHAGGTDAGSAYVFVRASGVWTQQAKLTASDPGTLDLFALSVALDGDTAVIGACGDDHAGGTRAGSAYVFVRSGGLWTQQAKLTASDAAGGDKFGTSVALDGDTAVIGANQAGGTYPGSAYVFRGLSDCNSNGTVDICDIAEGTSADANTNGIPDECEPRLDIKPGSCPNPFNRSSHGVLPAALLGTAHFDATTIDVTSIRLARADGIGGDVAPHEGPPGPHSVFEDVGTPFEGETCDCHEAGADGFVDLSMKFQTTDVVANLLLDDLDAGALVELVVTGELLEGTGLVASDCVLLVPPGVPPALLSVQSSVAGAWVDVSPADETLDGGGFADFQRTFPPTTVVTLTAEEWAEGRPLRGWQIGGLLHHMGETSVEFAIDQDMTVRAVYGPTPGGGSPKPPGEMTPGEMTPDEMAPEPIMEGQSPEAGTIDRR